MEKCLLCGAIGGYHHPHCQFFDPIANAKTVMPSKEFLEEFVLANIKSDPVNHPSHYTSDPSGVECIEITRWLDFNLGNAFKYVFRAGSKRLSYQDANMAAIEDLEKAVFYLDDELTNIPYNGMMLQGEVLTKILKVAASRTTVLHVFFESTYVALKCGDEVIYRRELLRAKMWVLERIKELKK